MKEEGAGRPPILRPLLSGGAWAFVTQATSKASVLFVTIVGARMLGAREFGLFAALQGLTILSAAVWDAGLSPMLTRDTAAGEAAVGPTIRRVLGVRLALLPLWLVLFGAGALLLGAGSEKGIAVALLFGLAGLMNGASMIPNAVLLGQLRFRSSALGLSAGRIVFAIASSAALLPAISDKMTAMAAAVALGEFTTLAFQLKSARPHGLTARPRFEGMRNSLRLVRRSLPYAANGLLNTLYNRLDVAIVAAVAGSSVAGLYAPASRIQDAMLIVPTTVVGGVVPVAARVFGSSGSADPRVGRAFVVTTFVSVGLTLPLAVAVAVLARPLISLTLGGDFQESVRPVQILALSLPFIAAAAPAVSVLVALGRAGLATLVYASGMVAAVGGLLVCSPLWGAEGAAWASMMREPLILVVAAAALLKGWQRTQLPLRGKAPAIAEGAA